jgi:hypothetical protein
MLSREAKGSKAKRMSKGNQPKKGAGAGPGMFTHSLLDVAVFIFPSRLTVLLI